MLLTLYFLYFFIRYIIIYFVKLIYRESLHLMKLYLKKLINNIGILNEKKNTLFFLLIH